ncbi:MAG: trimeric intracellular cation channel family protein [Tissierellia bacterium]|nr:trimeric intracellular cation channel family protein [Tissierellia bacterium]
MTSIISFLEILGVVVFAITGALEAIKSSLDLLGVLIIGVITAVGGGIIRDLVLGINPPASFNNPKYIYIATFTSFAVFSFAYFNKKIMGNASIKIFDKILTITDAIGLAVFTILGMKVAYSLSYEYRGVIYIFVGLITGVGGGIIRDILLQKVPYILDRNIYASASIVGALIFYLMTKHSMTNELLRMEIAIGIIFLIRIYAAKRDLNLPKVN